MKTKIIKKNKLPLLGRGLGGGLWAQNGVTVKNLVVEPGTVTFNVSWDANNPDMPALWSDTVWVFVDYNNNGKMERLPVAGATASAGTVIKIPGNDKGVWVVGNARTNGSFSATVKLHTATAPADLNGLCAYAINYSPVGEYITAQTIKFTGTPPYDLVFKNGNTLSIDSSPYVLPEALQSFTDQTGAPGMIKCLVPAITHSGGDASQTVDLNTAITTITYTASNATGIALSSGSFPTGVTGSANGLVFTISGTPTVVGTFGYAVTASNTPGCAGATSSGTITVTAAPPPTAASTQTWTIGNQTWSDRIVATPSN